jgi:formate hydrogenlyase transcriptional activator
MKPVYLAVREAPDVDLSPSARSSGGSCMGDLQVTNGLLNDAERYRTLLEVNNAVISNLTEEALFHAICAAVQRVIPHDRSAIFLHDSERNALRLSAIESSVNSPRFVVGLEVDSQHSHAGWPFHHKRVLLRRNLEAEREFPSEDVLLSEGFRSMVSVPLVVKGRSIGAYCISSMESNRYSEGEADFLGQVAGQIALAIENMTAYKEISVLNTQMQEAANRSRAILEINNAIITKLSRDELFRTICQALRRIMPYDRAALTLYDPEEKVLRFVALEGQFSSDFFRIGQTLGIDDSHYGWAFVNQRPLLRQDTETEREYPPEQRAHDEGVRSYCAVPLIVRGESIGVINVLSYKKRQYSEADAEFLQEVANQVALAVKSYQEIAASRAKLEAENVYLQEEVDKVCMFEDIVGTSPAIQAVTSRVSKVAPTDTTVLITGETGTGKELIARAIHKRSRRSARAFVSVNCAAISAGLVESELFGHIKGAFTGAIATRDGRFKVADGGTIFLDEVGDLPLETQVKLLRVLQERTFEPIGGDKTVAVDVRILAATNRNLAEAARSGQFRPDLMYRLNVFPIHVPPLRERREDIPQLVMFLLQTFAQKLGKSVTQVSEDTMRGLVEYSWPGNIRELQNVIERGVILSTCNLLVLDHDFLPTLTAPASPTARETPASLEPTPSSRGAASLSDVERQHIESVLALANWVIEGDKGAARILNMNPSTLRSRLKKLGIHKPDATAA